MEKNWKYYGNVVVKKCEKYLWLVVNNVEDGIRLVYEYIMLCSFVLQMFILDVVYFKVADRDVLIILPSIFSNNKLFKVFLSYYNLFHHRFFLLF
jgi:hypothetical protein